MSSWIIPCNQHKTFNLQRYLQAGNIIVDWIQNTNFTPGDDVYIYLSRIEKRLAYHFVVESTNLATNDINRDELYVECWLDDTKYENAKEANRFVRLRYIGDLPAVGLSYSDLKTHGLLSTLIKAEKIKDVTFNYITEILARVQ